MKKGLFLGPVLAIASLMVACKDYSCLVPAGTTASTKLNICHVIGKKDKYELISVKASAAEGHIDHGDFLAPKGAKKDKDCVPPVVVPPVVVPPVVVEPPVVVVPPVVVTPQVVVVPPVFVVTPPDTTTTTPSTGTSGSGGTSTSGSGSTSGDLGGEEPATPPPTDGGDATLNPSGSTNCFVNYTSPECQL